MFSPVCTRFINLNYFCACRVKKLSTVVVSKEPWDLVSAICLERKPTITKDLNDIESKYSKIIQTIEFEMSYKSDHELRKIKDQVIAEELKKSGNTIITDQASLQSAQEFEDECNRELENFKFASRTTEDDLKKNLQSTNRELSQSLLLVIKQKLGNKDVWVLPQGVRQEGETMRQAAERVLKDSCGTELQTIFLGNAPSGFYKFKYPKRANKAPAIGMKIFFFKAQLVKGNVSREKCPDFQWLSQNQLDVLQPEDYLKSVRQFLI